MDRISSEYSLARELNKLATGNGINNAANDPAGSAISGKLTEQVNGYEQGTENTYNMKDLANTAEGALSTLSDGLQRIRELALQSMNGLYTDSDRKIMDFEVQQILEGINQSVSQTQYNGQNLLDGTFSNKQVASSPDGTGINISIPDLSLEGLGLKDFSLVGNFDLEALDKAIETVTDVNSRLGSETNRMGFTINSNQIAELNLAASRSRYNDTDMAGTITETKKQQFMNDVRIMMQQREQENEKQKLSLFL